MRFLVCLDAFRCLFRCVFVKWTILFVLKLFVCFEARLGPRLWCRSICTQSSFNNVCTFDLQTRVSNSRYATLLLCLPVPYSHHPLVIRGRLGDAFRHAAEASHVGPGGRGCLRSLTGQERPLCQCQALCGCIDKSRSEQMA